jgi:hypothetical protein
MMRSPGSDSCAGPAFASGEADAPPAVAEISTIANSATDENSTAGADII